MASRTADLLVRVTGSSDSAVAALSKTSDSAGRFQQGIDKAARFAAAGGLALAAFGKQAFDAASSAQQAAGAVDAVFGDSATAVHKFAKSSADATGLASSEYEDMASTFGAQLKNMGMAGKDLAPQTNELITLGADLAAQFGGSTSDAVGALSSLLRGETDPIERYGVSIKAADVAAQKAAMGLDGLTGKADKQATAQATLALLTEQTADAQGAFAREADTAAGQQARATAQYKNASAAIGKALLPVVSKLAEWLGKLGKFAEDNAGAIQALGFAMAAVVSVILAAKVGLVAYKAAQIAVTAATKIWSAAQWLLNAALNANPIGLVVIAIGGLVAAIVLIVKNWDKVTAALKWTWNWLKQNWPKLLLIITGPFGAAVLLIIKNWRKVSSWFRAFGRLAATIFRKVLAVARAVFGTIRDVIAKVITTAKKVVDWIRDRFVGAWRYLRDVVRTVFGNIRDVIVRTTDAIKRVIDWIRDRLVGAFRTARDVVRSVMQTIRDLIARVITPIQRVIGWLRGNLANAFRTVRSVVQTVMTAIRVAIQTTIDKVRAIYDFVANTFVGVWNTLKDTAVGAFNAVLSPIQAVIDKVRALIGVIQDAIGWLEDLFKKEVHGSTAPGLGGRTAGVSMARTSALTPSRFAAPTVAARGLGAVGGRATSTRGGGVVVNVNGALDPDGVARQINAILKGRSRRVGGVRRLSGAI